MSSAMIPEAVTYMLTGSMATELGLRQELEAALSGALKPKQI